MRNFLLKNNEKKLKNMTKPTIIVLSSDNDDNFRWLSDGWFHQKVRHTLKAKKLFAKASNCISTAVGVPDAIKRLQKAGFTITRNNK